MTKLKLVDWLLIAACTVLFLGVWAKTGRAHNPETHQQDEFSQAYSDAYGVCCTGDDYTKLRIEQWEPTDNGWRVRWHGQWLDAPRNTKVINVANPDGDAKAWVNGTEGAWYVRCFMPGAQS